MFIYSAATNVSGIITDLNTVKNDVVSLKVDTGLIKGYSDTLETEVLKIPKSDSNVVWNPTANKSIMGTSVKKSIATLTAGSTSLFTVSGGAVKIIGIIGHITGGFQGVTNNIKLQYTTTGGVAVDLCGVVDGISATLNSMIYITGVKTDAMIITSDDGVVFGTMANITVTPGIISFNSASNRSGTVDWYINYISLSLLSVINPA